MLMSWVVVSRVGAGGFHVSSEKKFGMGGGIAHLSFNFLQHALHHFLDNHPLSQR
jgi:hypothetical protein